MRQEEEDMMDAGTIIECEQELMYCTDIDTVNNTITVVRGALGTVVRAERKLTSGNRDTLYEANVNPIATFPNEGVVVFGQKTLQGKPSALDRINVR